MAEYSAGVVIVAHLDLKAGELNAILAIKWLNSKSPFAPGRKVRTV